VVVTVFPDAGYKYLSDKNLWESSPLPLGAPTKVLREGLG